MARCIKNKPSKAIPQRKLVRKSSMEKCIVDAEDFLRSTKTKRIVKKTRTMALTLEEGKRMLEKKNKKVSKKPTRKSLKAKPAVRSKPAADDARRAAPPAKKTVPPSVPKSTATTLIRAPSKDNIIRPTKATIFKTSSKDHLPLPAFGFIDVCFCVDATGSMSGQLAQVQSTIVAIIKKIQAKVRTEGITLRFAVVTYRDHPPQQSTYVTQYQDFTAAEEIVKYVNGLRATGGGDFPEAAHDGLIDACQKLNWVQLPGTPTLRYIFHVADAPPHGKQFLTGEIREGCLCGKTTAQIYHEINIRQIHYRLIKARQNPSLDEMERLFKTGIVDFDSVQIANAYEMDIRVSDMIIHQMLPAS